MRCSLASTAWRAPRIRVEKAVPRKVAFNHAPVCIPQISTAAHFSSVTHGPLTFEPFYKQFRPDTKPYEDRSNPPPAPWRLIDAKGQVVGRLATEIAAILRGKDKPTYAPNVDNGDYVVVINARDVVLTGQKRVQKLYRWHSGYPGGLKSRSASEMLRRKPEEVLRKAVYGMLPKNKMRVNIAKKLQIFADEEYPSPHRVKTFKNGRVTGYVELAEESQM